MKKTTKVNYPTIPTNIIVHLGAPNDAARNISVPFTSYIKNVASNEIYPTWPDAAIEANILAIISFALNRIYNEWYPSRCYSFNITSLPTYDQTFIENKEYFDVISKKVDEIFNNYIYREGQVQPLFAIYCDGKKTTCDGLSQWGSVTLAKQGKTPLEILKYYYGNDVKIFYNAPVGEVTMTYPGYVLELGEPGPQVEIIQSELNRIANNYPAIPKIEKVNGYFGVDTENAVKKFQEVFNLNVTGKVDYATWYKIKNIYNAVKRLNDLYSEGISENESIVTFASKLSYGDTGLLVKGLHYYLNTIAFFDQELPMLEVNGVYNDNTRKMIINFQNRYNIPATGEVDAVTWNKIKEVYNILLNNIPSEYVKYRDEFYPGRLMSIGMSGSDVKLLQNYLYQVCIKYKNIPGVRVTGIFDDLTESSVLTLQNKFDIEESGVVGPTFWNDLVSYAKEQKVL